MSKAGLNGAEHLSTKFGSDLTPQIAFLQAMAWLTEEDRSLRFIHIRELLIHAGFSQNGRNRIIHLSNEEIETLYGKCPIDDFMWNSYLNEIQVLLSKMDQVRKAESSQGRLPNMGRPFVTPQLADVIIQLAALKWRQGFGVDAVKRAVLRNLLTNRDWHFSFQNFFDDNHFPDERMGRHASIRSTIRFLEIYRNELILPPVLERRLNFDEYSLYLIEMGDFSWMDDGGEQYMEDIRDIPTCTLYDAMPDFHRVADWFIATIPDLDNNQTKRGWSYLNELSSAWHNEDSQYAYYETYFDECSGWKCVIDDRYEEWMNSFPTSLAYKLIPLTNPRILYEETQTMHHCVVSHLEDCLTGKTRIFSIRDASGEKRIATVEINFRNNAWKVTEFKGRFNAEFIYRLDDPSDPLSILMQAVVSWYDKEAPAGLSDLGY